MVKFTSNPRLRWAILAGIVAMLLVVVFIGCLKVENTQCSAISGVLGIAALCLMAWHGLIYAAQRKGGF